MRLEYSDKAVSEVVGTMIILAITIIGISMITLVGVPFIFNIQDMISVRNVEQSFTIIDSQASKAFFGDNPVQIIDLNLNAGTLEVQTNGTGKESYIEINRMNATGDKIYLPMGKLKYQLDERIVAYEGGGIWSKYPSGGSVMLSPPEFHYDGRTFTLPIIYMEGNASIGGKGTASISFIKKATTQVYPNTSVNNSRINPLNFNASGKVFVNITSEYYDAWAEYARNLIYTKVTTNSTNHMANIELTVVPFNLGAPSPVTQPINIRGLPIDENPLENFSFKLYMPKTANKIDIRAKNDDKQLIFFLDIISKTLTIGYKQDGYTDGETWGPYTFSVTEYPDDVTYIDLNLLDTSAYLLYNTNNVGATNAKDACQPNGFKINGLANPDYSWDILLDTNGSNPNNTQSLYNITQHYIWKMAQEGDISFFQCAPAGPKKFPNDSSTMSIRYESIGGITYLHVTNNTVGVSIK
jgi:hypothetical protein